MSNLELFPNDTGLVVVDVQERLLAAMPEPEQGRAMRNWASLIEMAGRLRLPVAVSEQYPRGLGQTVPALREMLGKLSPPPRFFDKLEFSCCEVPDFAQVVRGAGRSTWIVVGMECHVCVYQTVRGLLDRGLRVHVPCDGVLSRTKQNWKVGLALMDEAGATVTSTETALFDLVKRAGTDEFKAVSRLVK
jgi:nicotinamidase-related amidase